MIHGAPFSIQKGGSVIQATLLFTDRKTLEIAVYPDYSVLLIAPIGSNTEKIHFKAQKRFFWIKKQMRFFEQFHPKTSPRKFIGGETHIYLGRSYRLKIVPKLAVPKASVILKNGYFEVIQQISAASTRKQIMGWYKKQSVGVFSDLLDECCKNFPKPISKPKIQIRHMKKRWGSLSGNGLLTLNADLIRAPKDCIRTIIFHELCHLIHPNHSKDFYVLLDLAFSNWKESKLLLETRLA